jgi:hypothetical protein
MTSRCPGMDPFLEDPAFWEDFERRFITSIADALLDRLPPSYDAHINERVRLVQADSARAGSRLPDGSIDWSGEQPAGMATAMRAVAGAAVIEPVSIPMAALEEHRDVWVEIIHLPERNLVTSIEVLSPTNKAGDDAADYHNKRVELYTRGVNLVEIDLLRGGERLTLAKPLPAGDYYAFVTRHQRRPFVDVYAWPMRAALPCIPIPLMPQDGDAQLDLAHAFADAFRRGHYANRLRYDCALTPVLSPSDQSWVDEVLKADGE